MMKRWIQFFKHKAYNFRWALLSGVLVGTSYIPFPPWALLFCYTPLWIATLDGNKTLRQGFWQGWVTQFTLTLIGFHWIAYTAHEFGKMPWAVSVVALLLFCASMHIYVALAPVAVLWLRQRMSLSMGAQLFLVALLHSLFERFWPAIFQWNLGYTLYWAKLPVYHLADIVGFEGLSTVVLLFNAWLGWVWFTQTEVKNALSHLAAVIIAFSGLVIFGAYHGAQWNTFDSQVRATVIQANIGNHEKIYAEKGKGFQAEIITKFLKLSTEALQKFPETEILIWPETAFPDYLDQHFLGRKHTKQLAEGLKPLGRPVITGAFSKDEKTSNDDDRSSYNALFLIDEQGNSLDQPYRKTELLAFGEYLPLSERFPIILTWLPFISNFGRGLGPDTMTWNRPAGPVNWGGQICYEGLYPEFTRGLAQKKSDILVNVTNDSWFGKSFEPSQHLSMTLARAIEVRRPLVRSTNTGISTAVLANGQVLEQSPLHKEWYGEFVIRYKKSAPETLFVRFGHRAWILIVSAILLILIWSAYHARARRP